MQQQSILFEVFDLTEKELSQVTVVRSGKIILRSIPGTKPQLFKAENTTDDVMNIYKFGLEVGALIIAKTVKENFKVQD